ncbi:leucine-rich repeat domain-containing protein, partial [Pelagicoccus mobilis]
LASLTNLKRLYLANNAIEELDTLASLVELEEVDLSQNQIEDLSVLVGLTELKAVTLYDNPVDLTEGGEQATILNSVVANTGADVVLVNDAEGTLLLTIRHVDESDSYELLWEDEGVLQKSDSVDGPWLSFPNATSPYPIDTSNDTARFWRLIQP